MKKIFIAIFALIGCAVPAAAIDYEPEEGFTTQINVGMTTSNINGTFYDSPFIDDYKCKVGATAGVKVDLMIPNAKGVYISAGADYAMKGAMKTIEQDFLPSGSYNYTRKIRLHYIQIPVHLGFRYNFYENFGVYGEVGPYAALGITGKSVDKLDADGAWTAPYNTSYLTFKKGDNQTNFQRVDAGIGFRLGAEYDNHYSINLGFDWGILDMYRKSYRDKLHDNYVALGKNIQITDMKNFCFSATFGYRF